MEVDERDTDTKQSLREIEDLIENEQYDEATEAIDALRDRIGEFPELVGLQTRMDVIGFLSDEEDGGSE